MFGVFTIFCVNGKVGKISVHLEDQDNLYMVFIKEIVGKDVHMISYPDSIKIIPKLQSVKDILLIRVTIKDGTIIDADYHPRTKSFIIDSVNVIASNVEGLDIKKSTFLSLKNQNNAFNYLNITTSQN